MKHPKSLANRLEWGDALILTYATLAGCGVACMAYIFIEVCRDRWFA